MAITWPAKNNYATGDVLTATNMNGIGDDLNALFDNSFYAGKNKIINGDFGINQRNFTSTTTSSTYGFDRWRYVYTDGTVTYSAQTFTAGSAPVTGYEGTNFARLVTTGQTLASARAFLNQRIESVRTFANQTVTISFWAKAASGTPSIAVAASQIFGTGGSATVTTPFNKVTISTSWTRYSITGTIPSISGKTIAGGDDNLSMAIWVSAGSDNATEASSIGIQSNTFDIWGVQLESGSTATPFQTATGTKQGELAACQRYYWRAVSGGSYGLLGISGYVVNSTTANINVNYPVFMRTIPTSVDYSTLTIQDSAASLYAVSAASINTDITNNYAAGLNITISGATSGRWARMLANNSTNAYIGFSAEL